MAIFAHLDYDISTAGHHRAILRSDLDQAQEITSENAARDKTTKTF